MKAVLLLVCLLVSSAATASDHVTIIVNKSTQIGSLSAPALRSIFSMRRRSWEDGTEIRVFVMPRNSQIHEVFSQELLDLMPYQLERAWDRNYFAGIGRRPAEVASTEDMLNRVASTPGAIGYVPTQTIKTAHIAVVEVIR